MHYIRLKTHCVCAYFPLNKSNGWCTCIGYRLQGSITWLWTDSVLDIYSVTPKWSRRMMSAGREGASKWTACDWLDLHSCLSCHGKSHTYKDTKSKQPYKHTFKHSHSKKSYAIFSLFSVALMRIMWLMACSYFYLWLCVWVEAAWRQIGLVRAPFTVLKAAFLWPLHMSHQPACSSDVFWESAWTYVCVWWGREYMHTSVKRSEKERWLA